mgnify:CR=1 FL=1
MFPKKIESNWLLLEELKPKWSVAKRVYRAICRNREEFSPWLDRVFDINSARSEFKFIWRKFFSDEIEYWIYWKWSFIWCIWLFNIDDLSSRAELWIWLDGGYTGHGHMTDAVKLLLENVWFSRIEAKIDQENLKSRAVLYRCGFQYEWTLHRYRFSPFFKRNRTMDLFALLK